MVRRLPHSAAYPSYSSKKSGTVLPLKARPLTKIAFATHSSTLWSTVSQYLPSRTSSRSESWSFWKMPSTSSLSRHLGGRISDISKDRGRQRRDSVSRGPFRWRWRLRCSTERGRRPVFPQPAGNHPVSARYRARAAVRVSGGQDTLIEVAGGA